MICPNCSGLKVFSKIEPGVNLGSMICKDIPCVVCKGMGEIEGREDKLLEEIHMLNGNLVMINKTLVRISDNLYTISFRRKEEMI